MSLPNAVIDAMLAAGCTAEQLAAAMKAANDEAGKARTVKRANDAERQRRSRSNRSGRAVSRNVTVTECDIPPNDIYSNPPEPQSSNDDCPPLAEKVVSAWNEQSKNGLTASRGLDANRRKALAARVRDHGEQAVFDAIRRLGASEWHCGKNDRGWTANLGWLLKSPENFLKALELPEPPEKRSSTPHDRATHLASKIEFYRKIGKDWEADECQRELAKLTGPPAEITAH